MPPNDRKCHQNNQEETYTLSLSSFNDEDIPTWNFNPKNNENYKLMLSIEAKVEKDEKSKKIKKN